MEGKDLIGFIFFFGGVLMIFIGVMIWAWPTEKKDTLHTVYTNNPKFKSK